MERVINQLTTLNLGPFINFIVNGIIEVFQMLEDIEFLGTNMLQFTITLIVLGILVPIIFTIPRGFSVPRSGRVAENGTEYRPRHGRTREMLDRQIAVTIDGERRSDRYK